MQTLLIAAKCDISAGEKDDANKPAWKYSVLAAEF